ncbi:hypothetical protein E3T26_12945 [Cryobacterium sp. TMT1-21]|uniref:hypothetical protein n=1 Tax=Cryobacterium sp. TMT1-21 TaxID=1259234 RepID=UPI00106A33AD|nr:hypothetical protein [Cryobacterium sp. TMT1-21]TFD11325.1 hypothetical protein E3T26_12945 [Cryobacterium sp. TMT1-21]
MTYVIAGPMVAVALLLTGCAATSSTNEQACRDYATSVNRMVEAVNASGSSEEMTSAVADMAPELVPLVKDSAGATEAAISASSSLAQSFAADMAEGDSSQAGDFFMSTAKVTQACFTDGYAIVIKSVG